MIALCHSELYEALEEYRAGRPMEYVDDTETCERITDPAQFNGRKPEGIAVEMADCIIRIAEKLRALSESLDDVWMAQACRLGADALIQISASPEPQTNSDEIRSMEDNELAEFLCNLRAAAFDETPCDNCPGAKTCRTGHNGMIDWVRCSIQKKQNRKGQKYEAK